jgi:hypothetical protein
VELVLDAVRVGLPPGHLHGVRQLWQGALSRWWAPSCDLWGLLLAKRIVLW